MNESDTFRVPPPFSDTARIAPPDGSAPAGGASATPPVSASALPPPPPPGAAPGQVSPPQRGAGAVLRSLWQGCLVASFGIVAFSAAVVALGAWSCSRAVARLKPVPEAVSEETGGDGVFALSDVKDLNLARKGKGPGKSAPRVLRVALDGVISSEPGDTRPWKPETGTAAAAIRDIRRATLDPRIDGILLAVDSPGGEVTASDMVWKALKDFRASRQDTATPRFVVALMGSTAASGAYYACAAADCIVAHPTTLTGSIGVKMSSINVRGLADRYGVKEVSIVSGPNKNMLSPFSDLTEQQRQMLQAQVNALQDRFVDLVAKGRHLEEARVREVADGRILLAEEAKKAGLVDEIGYLDDAKAEVSKRLGGEVPRYVEYSRQDGLLRAVLSPEFFGAAIRSAAAPDSAAASRGATMEAEGL